MSWTRLLQVLIGLFFIYLISKLLNVFGMNISEYGTYLFFYIFLLISTLILPTTINQPLSSNSK